MPEDYMGRWVDSKTDLRTDILGFGEIGGIGQLIYRLFRFKKYEIRYVEDGRILACPICSPGYEVEFSAPQDLTGASLLVSLYNLALKINDPSEEKPFDELIIDWCNRVAHPYFVDELNALMVSKQFDITTDYHWVEKDGIFDINDFMHDLEKFYQAASFAFAIDQMMNESDDAAFALASDGRYFSSVPFFEKYRYSVPKVEKCYDPISPTDLLKEMQDSMASLGEIHANTVDEWYAHPPFGDYAKLRDKLIDMIPDFRLRLKVNHKRNQVVLAADIHSVFDIAWFTLAKKICEDARPKVKQTLSKLDPRENPVMLTCPICGKAFVRKGKGHRRIYCDDRECQKRRAANNTQNTRRRQKLAALQAKAEETEQP